MFFGGKWNLCNCILGKVSRRKSLKGVERVLSDCKNKHSVKAIFANKTKNIYIQIHIKQLLHKERKMDQASGRSHFSKGINQRDEKYRENGFLKAQLRKSKNKNEAVDIN